MLMSKLKIIRASAGSGKTYSLTQEVLLTLINEELKYYRHILAVTFTNKATAEMKQRILKELHLLASKQKSDHLDILMKYSNKSEGSVRSKANAILQNILHGYSWFRVETIDTFFQGIIRSFVRELGIAGNYNIELDQDKILNEAIDALLENIGNDKDVLKWLLEHVDNKISEGKSWDITGELLSLGRTLFSESLITRLPNLQSLLSESDFIKAYRNALIDIRDSFEKKITQIAKSAFQAAMANGMELTDYSYGKAGPVGYLKKLSNNTLEAPKGNTLKVLDSGKWAGGKSTRKEEALNIGVNTLTPALQQIIELFNTEEKDYNTASIILKNLHIMGMLVRLNSELSKIRNDKSIFLISDAAPFIQKIINQNDTPFIYEKAGNHFNHLLIDEFQDTSNMQWGNFKPLISNSLSKGKSCLLVGDVKQSIYRWRNSNWEILENQVNQDFNKEVLDPVTLETNWRSDKTIIDFNNAFFLQASKLLDQHLADYPIEISLPGAIYKDVSQLAPPHKTENKGYISVKVFDKADKKDDDAYYRNELIEKINDALSKGYEPGDIAILIRNKKEGTLLANDLVEANKQNSFHKNVGVISNESLFLNSSPMVNLLLAAMRFISKPDSELLAASLLTSYLHSINTDESPEINFPKGKYSIDFLNEYFGNDFLATFAALKQESLYSIAEKLSIRFNLFNADSNLVYLHSFLDLVFDYSSKEQSDLGRFLAYWDEEGAKKTISAAETESSIRILTIHKSKGLEFPIVILPFVNWSMLPMPNEKLWLEPTEDPYKKLPFVPVNFTAQLDRSIFQSDYAQENYLSIIDNLNLLYVAFTRAESVLIAFVSNETKELKAVNKLIVESLNHLTRNDNKQLPITFNDDENRYTVGSLVPKEGQKETVVSTTMKVDKPSGLIPKVRISRYSDEFMNESIDEKDSATQGNILHSIMENCLTVEDISKSIKTKIEEGVISEIDEKSIYDKLHDAINNTEAKDWFCGKYQVLNEADIIAPGGAVKRPDRVMLKNDSAIVVDYKFGQEDDKEKHLKQVGNYMKLIKESGINTVTGYVWYVSEGDIVAVN